MRWPLPIAVSLMLTIAVALPVAAQSGDSERKIRNVTPENIPVIILPPRPKNEASQQANEPPIPGDRVTALLSEHGVVTTNGKALRFLGITTIANDTLCESEKGGRWACGLRAYVALRNLVHGKELKCEVLHVRSGQAISRCFRDRTNISDWMLAEGWAFYDDSAKDDALARFAEDAQKNARGIWANGSRPLKR
ncbi:MAG: thermonuclease family protein [Xanthobacteraceae bacterium]|nr:thermonuclease family protein [Xanthobacteraceae bacterium]